MALLIYKQWHRQPNIKNTPASNAAHVKYIGERSHVMKSENCENGLFGVFDEQRFGYKIDMDRAMKYVRKLSENGHTIFRSMVSFTPEIAQTLHLEDKRSFEYYIKSHIYSMSKHNGIETKNFEYLAAVHDKEGQPHFHVVFWDKAQEVGKNFVNPLIGDKIRNELEERAAKEIISEFPEGYFQNWETNDNVRRTLIKNSFKNAFSEEYKIQKSSAENISDILGKNLTGETNFPALIAEQFNLLLKNRPRTGRNYYSFMSREYKLKLNKFTNILIESNPSLKAEYDRMMSSHETIAFALNSGSTNYGKLNIATYLGKMQDKFYAKAGNKILRELKNTSQVKDKNCKNHAKFDENKMANQILRLLKSLTPREDTPHLPETDAYLKNADLSKTALKDAIQEKQDKGHEM
ncbi:MAG: relaxase MobL [Oscillospiraceae bacterium]|nr:relaxase MobL [Oscillospiraceae bacterium]